ncbi:hypothetical protein J6590_017598 [Homalodisca vitripennis]|nr:hypothetical protein J6590_017598 [Homalodisca vitripennis]
MPFSPEEEIMAGESIQLTCHISKGDRPLQIRWNFHGEELSSHLGITTTKVGDRTSMLNISPTMAAHSGNYTCTATNRAGSSSYTATLFVLFLTTNDGSALENLDQGALLT